MFSRLLGRLWASLIQLRHGYGEIQQVQTLKRALQAVPKVGNLDFTIYM